MVGLLYFFHFCHALCYHLSNEDEGHRLSRIEKNFDSGCLFFGGYL